MGSFCVHHKGNFLKFSKLTLLFSLIHSWCPWWPIKLKIAFLLGTPCIPGLDLLCCGRVVHCPRPESPESRDSSLVICLAGCWGGRCSQGSATSRCPWTSSKVEIAKICARVWWEDRECRGCGPCHWPQWRGSCHNSPLPPSSSHLSPRLSISYFQKQRYTSALDRCTSTPVETGPPD